MMNETPEAFYQKQKEERIQHLQTVTEKRKRIGWQRLLAVLLTFFVAYETWDKLDMWLIIGELAIGLAVFLYLVSKDTDTKNEAQNLQRLIDVAEKEISILNHNYRQYETGEEYLPANHAYAQDLDIFGTASLYQYINRCTSEQGKKLFATRLLHPLPAEQVTQEQEAVTELTSKPIFRQQLQAFGAANYLTVETENKVMAWLSQASQFESKIWSWLAIVFPLFTITLVVLYIADIINASLFSILVFGCFLFAFSVSKKIQSTYLLLSKTVNETETFFNQLSLIEKEIFAAQKLKKSHTFLTNEQGKTASAEVKHLRDILGRFDVRLNVFAFFFLNTFLLWDLQQILSLNKWKQQNKNTVPHWFSAIAEMEVSNSLATVSFNHPQWVTPRISDHFFSLTGINVGHPLLPETVCVTNSFSLEGKGKIAIITGSNMGGKSTFLRSVGVNIVLALSGSVVCADEFVVSGIYLMSSMRVADNLSESTSTFYAELKKLKTIIEAVNRKESVFILLDEILRGTNSLDRHAGSAALLKQFIKKEAVAVITTHDIELAKLATDYPQAAENYHFDVQVKQDEFYFDYKLKAGICQSMNASVLMKNIGIELE